MSDGSVSWYDSKESVVAFQVFPVTIVFTYTPPLKLVQSTGSPKTWLVGWWLWSYPAGGNVQYSPVLGIIFISTLVYVDFVNGYSV